MFMEDPLCDLYWASLVIFLTIDIPAVLLHEEAVKVTWYGNSIFLFWTWYLSLLNRVKGCF